MQLEFLGGQLTEEPVVGTACSVAVRINCDPDFLRGLAPEGNGKNDLVDGNFVVVGETPEPRVFTLIFFPDYCPWPIEMYGNILQVLFLFDKVDEFLENACLVFGIFDYFYLDISPPFC